MDEPRDTGPPEARQADLRFAAAGPGEPADRIEALPMVL
jgi:hypothetical protein